jgi:hypothetical protein
LDIFRNALLVVENIVDHTPILRYENGWRIITGEKGDLMGRRAPWHLIPSVDTPSAVSLVGHVIPLRNIAQDHVKITSSSIKNFNSDGARRQVYAWDSRVHGSSGN